MTWFVVGGVAIGATAGAIVGSKKGGDEVWKDALIGGAIGGTAGYGAGAIGGAEAVAPVVAEGVAPTVGTTGATALPAAGAFGSTGAATVGEVGGFAPVVAESGAAGSTAAGSTGAGLGAPTTGAWGSGFGSGATQSSIAGGALDTGSAGFGSTGGATVGGSGGGGGSILNNAFNTALKTMSDHPFLTAAGGYFGLNALGAFNNQNQGQPFGTNTQTAAGYPMSPNFRPSREDPEKYRYTPRYAAEGGIMGYAPGGMVQQDPMNPIQNSIYPQSQQEHTNFATSTQYPNSMASAMASDYDTRTNPQTGQELPMGMAAGGIAHYSRGREVYAGAAQEFAKMADRKLGASAPDTPDWVRSKGIYSDTDPSTRYKDAVNAAITRNAALAKKYDMGGPQLRVPTGGLGSINMGPMTKDKKGTDTESDEAFAGGGMARYSTGGQPQDDNPVHTIVMMNQPQQQNAFESPIIRQLAGQQVSQSDFDKYYGPKNTFEDSAVIRHVAGLPPQQQKLAGGGISSLGGYANGGNPRLLRGPGDGMSDDIPATIGGRQPARLADGEFVIPADVVSALGNGSTEAGAKHLHAMMDKTRQQAHGKKTQMKKVNPKKVMPA